MKNIVLFASGSGSNVENIIGYFKKYETKFNFFIFTNNPNAYVIERAKKMDVPCFIVSKNEIKESGFLNKIEEIKPDLIVLAGFLLMFPASIIEKYPNKVINIHPALLPKYGGKGMYGMHVHEAVVANKESETGITIHYVNEKYDEGAIIFQAKTSIDSHFSANDVANAIHKLEHEHFPKVIENLLNID
ncbi:phosphoribosylglycinamide formyltransferase [Flavobacterium sp. I3-2]|uniref:phosphoribosylglycinamide formyltransferase n=1 Tax=Flavobacterium sp. I3-2 TaxID=2748319 RepID=UPI0015B22D81|nr:phosphoribosylglycinamide formyltransferase [Flavobacterium sp. I3-2]